MLTTFPLAKSAQAAFDVLQNDGTVVLPSKLGYGFLAISSKAVERLYDLKDRPKTKPSGILATPTIFKAITNSRFAEKVHKLNYPVGILESPVADHPAVIKLPRITKQNGRVAFFFHMDPFFEELADHAWEHGELITITSANKAGTGNCMRYDDIHPDIKAGADLIINNDQLTWFNERKNIDPITASLIDLREGKMLRKGIFSARIKALAVEQNMITDHLPAKSSPLVVQKYYQSCIYLIASAEKTYQRIPTIRNVDCLVLDLEDGCPADRKERARQLIAEYAAKDTFDDNYVAVRLNGLSTLELEKDLQVDYTPKIRGFALPMLQNAEDVHRFERKIAAMEKRLGLPDKTFKLFPIIETAEALSNVDAIAKASERSVAMFLGHADLFGELYSKRNKENLHTVRMLYLKAARAAGIAAFDTPWENVKDLNGLEEDAKDGQAIGLDGKVALSFEQLEIINRTFGLSTEEKETYERLLSKYTGGCQIIEGVFVAPPIVKRFRQELKKRVYDSLRLTGDSTHGKTISYGLDYRNAFPGQIIQSPYETTVDESFITQWQSMVQTGNPLETSRHFCEQLGMHGRLIPFHNLVNLGLCLIVETFSESSLFHLGISNVVYEYPVYAGDTVRSVMIIDDIVPSSNKKYTIFKTRMIMVNQNNQRVVSMNRNSLFKYILPSDLKPAREQKRHADFRLFAQKGEAHLRASILSAVKRIDHPMLKKQPAFKAKELILHSLARPMGLSNSLAYSTLYKNTHPLHINSARYGMDGLVVCGGFIIPVIHGIASRDIRFAMDQEIVDTMHINSIHHEDCIGAMSYIVDREERMDGIECLTIRTFGLKNIDAERDLKDLDIPNELLQSNQIKPREIELICKTYAPELHHKICARMTWKIWRKM